LKKVITLSLREFKKGTIAFNISQINKQTLFSLQNFISNFRGNPPQTEKRTSVSQGSQSTGMSPNSLDRNCFSQAFRSAL
jgi:hypothetical protein